MADLNGDGFPDLAVANAGSNDVSILLNDGAWPGPAPPPGGGTQGRVLERRTSPAPVAVAVADLVRHAVEHDLSHRRQIAEALGELA